MRLTAAKARAAALAAPVALAACAADHAHIYRQHAAYLQNDGYLRTEAAPRDAPYSNEDLARNFLKIALNREYRRERGALLQEETPAPISRWEEPLRYRIAGQGATAEDRSVYAGFAQRLTSLTGLPFEEVDEAPNVSILILDAEERRAFVDALSADGAAERMPLVIDWAEEPRYPCIGQVGYKDVATGRITGALIVIKAELEGVFRQSCIHEELTQALGLMNDDSFVRPSIFNDDQEFALLTEHDEYLLRILYDRRLSPGMGAEEVRAVLPEIIAEIRPEG